MEWSRWWKTATDTIKSDQNDEIDEDVELYLIKEHVEVMDV